MVGQRNVYIATAPIDAPSCASGKMIWIQRNLPQWIHRQFLITPCKFVASHPGALLIDDFEDNIRFFQGRGGSTITVPRPWNRLRGREPSGHIAMELFRTFGYRG
jgi:5'(3')-deoxyribonucleotidase